MPLEGKKCKKRVRKKKKKKDEDDSLSVLLVDKASLFNFNVEVLLQQVSALVVLALGRVVLPTVSEDPLHVCHEQLPCGVVTTLQALTHSLQVYTQKSGSQRKTFRYICTGMISYSVYNQS